MYACRHRSPAGLHSLRQTDASRWSLLTGSSDDGDNDDDDDAVGLDGSRVRRRQILESRT